ncbi:hypothetical protein C4556_00735 [Candidatus Parcubacteria bacterium]|nr:MAG: hypothetical protein C4556_00735 [Candidatus Parcubacteria bacterium]
MKRGRGRPAGQAELR